MDIVYREPPFPEYEEYLKQCPSTIALIDGPRKVEILTDVLSQCMEQFDDKSFRSYHFYYYNGQNLRDFQRKQPLKSFGTMIPKAFRSYKNDCLGYYKNYDIYLDITAFDIPSKLEEILHSFSKQQIGFILGANKTFGYEHLKVQCLSVLQQI